jgi:putative Mn2+ efflux pump MntP
MKNDWHMPVLFILIGIIFAITPFVGTLSNPMLWLAAAIFLFLGLWQLVKFFKK